MKLASKNESAALGICASLTARFGAGNRGPRLTPKRSKTMNVQGTGSWGSDNFVRIPLVAIHASMNWN